MKKAIFLDFYGTVVHEDGENVRKISQMIFDTGEAESILEIGAYWWNEFSMLFTNAYGENFKTQRAIEYQSLVNTVKHFKSNEDAEKLSNMLFEC